MNQSKPRWKLPVIIICVLILLGLCAFGAMVMINEYALDMTLLGESEITLEYGDSFEDPGATACYYGTIFQQEPLDVPVTVAGQVELAKVGSYTLTYTAAYEELSDSITRTVHVVDTVDPELALLGEEEVTLPVGAEYEEPGWIASDNYNGDLADAVKVTGQLDASIPGSYVLT